MSFSDATEKVKSSEKHRFDSELNDYFWWKIRGFFGKKENVDDSEGNCKTTKTNLVL